MHNIQVKNGLEDMPKLSDHASLIGGSGMGGYVIVHSRSSKLHSSILFQNNRLMSLFMGRLRMETLAAIKAYDQFCNDVFTNEKVVTKSTRYDSISFEKAFRVIAKEAGFDADDPMEEQNPKCKTYV
jgi:hypothetical protein